MKRALLATVALVLLAANVRAQDLNLMGLAAGQYRQVTAIDVSRSYVAGDFLVLEGTHNGLAEGNAKLPTYQVFVGAFSTVAVPTTGAWAIAVPLRSLESSPGVPPTSLTVSVFERPLNVMCSTSINLQEQLRRTAESRQQDLFRQFQAR